MKDKLMKNFGLKILSLLIATIIWVIIVNVDDPIITRKFADIPVTTKNAEAIAEIDKVYTIIDGDTVDVYVTGRRQFVNSLTRADISADADLSVLSDVGATYIEAHVNKASSTSPTIELGSTKMMKVQLEDKETIKKQLEIALSGEVDSEYAVVNKEAKPNIISISGAESVVSKIESVVLDVNVQNRNASFKETVALKNFKVYDYNRDLISNDKLEFSEDEITVSITIQRTKEVELNIIPVGQPKNGYKLAEFVSLPETIKVTGTDEVLNRLSSITCDYDISGLYEDFEENLSNYNQFLSALEEAGVTLVDEGQTIALSVIFEKLENEEIEISKNQIEIKGVPTGYVAEINTNHFRALVQGKADIVKSLSASDLKPYIDLTNYREGTSLVNLKFLSSSDYSIMNEPVVNITLNKIVAPEEGSRGEE